MTVAFAFLYTSSIHAQSLVQIASLNSLPESIQNDINQLCLPSQYRDGASAYRKCVAKQIDLRNSDSAILMDNYSFDEKYAIQQSCGGEADSSENYLNCIKQETAKLDAVPVPVLNDLNEDEENAIQLSCYDAQKYEGAATYRQCINTAYEQLLSIPRTNLSQLSSIKQNEIKLECTNASRQNRSVNYRLCIAESLENILIAERNARIGITPQDSSGSTNENTEVTIVSVPKPDDVTDLQSLLVDNDSDSDELQTPTVQVTSITTSPETDGDDSLKTIVVTEISNPEQGVGVIANAAAETLDSTDDTSASEATETAQTSSIELSDRAITTDVTEVAEPGNEQTTELAAEQINGQETAQATQEVAANTDTHSATPTTDQTEATAATDIQDPNTEQALSSFAAFKENPVEFIKNFTFSSDSDYVKLLLPVGVILVVLKLLSMLLRRRRRTHAPEQHYQPIDFSDDEFESGFSEHNFTTADRRVAEPVDLSDPFSDDPRLVGRGREDSVINRAPNFDFLDGSENRREYPPEEEDIPDTTSGAALLDQTLHTPIYHESEFGHWLHQQPVDNHKRLCTEFMLYWVSYGDGNYSPEQKEELLRAVDLNEHDLIKKWVLEQNPSTLVDMLQRVWSIFSKTEVEQTISMMFAVLVKNEISPVQNTFFRFLADFAHIGSAGLNKLHMDAFGSGLPPLPRPDDERWWQRQNNKQTQALSKAEMLEQSDYDICLSLLGLSNGAGPEEIKNAYAQIANRCSPEKFDRLGEKERDLVQRHLSKYTQAYEYLLELNQ